MLIQVPSHPHFWGTGYRLGGPSVLRRLSHLLEQLRDSGRCFTYICWFVTKGTAQKLLSGADTQGKCGRLAQYYCASLVRVCHLLGSCAHQPANTVNHGVQNFSQNWISSSPHCFPMSWWVGLEAFLLGSLRLLVIKSIQRLSAWGSTPKHLISINSGVINRNSLGVLKDVPIIREAQNVLEVLF